MFSVVSGVVSTSTVNLFFSENPIMSIETSSYNLLENSNHFFAIAVVGAAAAAARQWHWRRLAASGGGSVRSF